jgi:hypothetical protein
MTRTPAEVRDSLTRRHWEPKIIDNMLRGDVAEDIVDGVLAQHGWRLCSGSGTGWDFEHNDGTRVQLKQTALLQNWKVDRPRPVFGIAAQTGHYADLGEGRYKFVTAPTPIRYAHIYVFAYHAVTDETADQCDPAQWLFYVVPTTRLPPEGKSISLNTVQKLSDAYTCDTLPDAMAGARHERRSDYAA